MPATRRAYLNDNIRTEHLKCSCCRTQIHLVKIESAEGGEEVRTFACPHCRARRLVRLGRRGPLQGDRGHGAAEHERLG